MRADFGSYNLFLWMKNQKKTKKHPVDLYGGKVNKVNFTNHQNSPHFRFHIVSNSPCYWSTCLFGFITLIMWVSHSIKNKKHANIQIIHSQQSSQPPLLCFLIIESIHVKDNWHFLFIMILLWEDYEIPIGLWTYFDLHG